MIILGIETSCDETAASVIYGGGDNIKILANIVSSQIEIHQKYGGVVPEIAGREHILNILPVINEAIEKSKIKKIDAIAITIGPGLSSSLMVGVETAKTLAFAWKIPIIAINHIEGHIYANFIDRSKSQIKFPVLILTVSGGHTMLILMTGHGKYRLLGETQDDAAGEAFDKAAQLLEIGYPGGPAISAEAEKFLNKKLMINLLKLNKPKIINLKSKIILPRPMLHNKDFNFSFSGLKTALLYAIQKDKKWKEKISEYCVEFQQAIVDVLIVKTIKAAKMLNCKTIMLSGGVSANKELRNQIETVIKTELINVKLIIPKFEYCTDNAAMIATAGYFRAKRKKFITWQKIKTNLDIRYPN